MEYNIYLYSVQVIISLTSLAKAFPIPSDAPVTTAVNENTSD